MTWKVTATRSAEADIAEAVDWYEQQSAGLGATLLADITAMYARIAANPRQFPVAYKGARKCQLRRFPYAMIFKSDDDEARLVAFFHTSRDPRGWQARV